MIARAALLFFTVAALGCDRAALSPGAADLSVPSVACGNTPCPVPGESCCTTNFGQSGACVAAGAQSCMNAFPCDGPEDCAAGQICCEVSDSQAHSAYCSAPGGCIRALVTWQMCHADRDCTLLPQDTSCCLIAPNAPYRHCLAQCP